MCRAQSVILLLAVFLLPPPIFSAESTYSGTVVAGGQPVAGAKVWLYSYHRTKGTDEGLIETRADSQGRFTLTKSKAPDTIPSEIIARAADGRIGWLRLFWNDPEESPNLRVELYPVGEARGRLTDSAGQPLSGVRLQVKSFGIPQKGASRQKQWQSVPDRLSSLFEATTAADGAFVLRGIPAGSQIDASVAAPRFGNPDVFWEQGQSGDFRLERAGRVRLHFTGAMNSKQLAGLSLNLFTYPATGQEDGKPFTNALKSITAKDQATLDVENVLPGRCDLRFFGDGKMPYVPTKLPEFIVKPGELTEVTLALESAAHIRGRVIDRQSKKGVAGAQINLQSTAGDDTEGRRPGSWVSLTTDAEGHFSGYIRAGSVGLGMWQLPDSYASSSVSRGEVKPVSLAGGTEHTFPDVVLEPAVLVQGLVVDESGKPVRGVRVRNTEEDFGVSRRGRIMTDGEGKFVLRGLGREDTVAIRVRNERAVTDGGIVVNLADQRGPIRLVLSEKAACRLKGRVVDNLNRPVAGATVRITWNYRGVGRRANMGIGAWLGMIKTDAEGRFQSGVLWPGDTYRVQVIDEGQAAAESIRVIGKAGEVHDLGEILLPRARAEVRGLVVDEAGQPLAGVNVFNPTDAPQPVTTVTEKTGRFHLSGLFDGPVFVFARKDGYRFTMTRAETGGAEARIVLLQTGTIPPAAADSVQAKARRDAEQKLLRHLLDKVLGLSEAATGGHRHHVFECLARTDLAKAQKWLDKEKAARGRLAPNDVRRYSRTLRKIQAEQTAVSDVDEAISLLSDLDAEDACTALRKLGERFQETEPDRGLRFAEEAVVKARALQLPNRVWHLATVGDLVVRLGQQQAGRKLLKEAEGLAEKLGTQGMQGYARGSAARLLAPYDLSRALLLIQNLEDREKNRWLSEMAGQLARTDPKAALALVDVLKEDRSSVRQATRLRIARHAALLDPTEGARIALAIPDVRYRAEALVHVATAVAGRDPKLAWSLIDQALAIYLDQPEPFRSWTNQGGRAVFAAWTVGQAHALGYSDSASAVARALACQLSGFEAHSPAHALETKVRMAKVLALVDPAAARHLLERVVPQQDVLGTGYSGFEKQDWLLACCLADPERGPALVDEAIAKLKRKDRDFYESGLMQLAQVLNAPPERRVRLVMGLNSCILFPNEE